MTVAVDAQAFASRPGQSACVLVDDGPQALMMRSLLADQAQKSIDLQTYLYEDDEAGIVLMDRLRAAAERGVRVRLLIDDIGLRTDDCLPLLLDALPNAEVRVFNPFKWRPRWTRPLQMPLEFHRLNHRMHNKLFLVDRFATIIGGRNVGGHYFEAHEETNFTDLDVLLLGPVAHAAQECFEHLLVQRTRRPRSRSRWRGLTPTSRGSASNGTCEPRVSRVCMSFTVATIVACAMRCRTAGIPCTGPARASWPTTRTRPSHDGCGTCHRS